MKALERIDTSISGLCLINPVVFEDPRGYFFETWSEEKYEDIGISCRFVQDNESQSAKGVLRGLHFQTEHPQAKLVRVIRGSVFDVVVDLRNGSPTFGQWKGFHLDGNCHRQLFIPIGFAHGFLAMEDNTVFAYKCSDIYSPQHETGIRWDDPQLAIKWPVIGDAAYLISEKDRQLPLFDAKSYPFKYTVSGETT